MAEMTTNDRRWPPVRLIDPTTDGFLLVAMSSGAWRLPLAMPFVRRRRVREVLRDLGNALAAEEPARSARTFRGFLRPPGDGSLPLQWQGPPRFDAVLLVRTDGVDAAERMLRHPALEALRAEHPDAIVFAAENTRRIGDVDHRRGIFLFNFFTADDVEENLDVWQYTAGWFQAETGLDNSTVLRPIEGDVPFSIVNHCQWDAPGDILPSLIGKRSFRDFVLASFARHRVAAHPTLYRLDRILLG